MKTIIHGIIITVFVYLIIYTTFIEPIEKEREKKGEQLCKEIGYTYSNEFRPDSGVYGFCYKENTDKTIEIKSIQQVDNEYYIRKSD